MVDDVRSLEERVIELESKVDDLLKLLHQLATHDREAVDDLARAWW